MFPYRDNLIGGTRANGVLLWVLAISLFSIPTFLNHTFDNWSLAHLSFIPLLFSVSPWSSAHRLVSATLLHADIFHLLGNGLFLWVFGRSLERLFGKLVFSIVFPFLGAAGFIFHWAVNSASNLPVIGASGAIATLMGSYLVLFPQARMRTIIFLGVGYKRVNMPAWSFLFYWISLQLMSLAFGSGAADNVAYAVHVGGFIFGVMGAMIWKVSYPFAEEHLSHFTAAAFRA